MAADDDEVDYITQFLQSGYDNNNSTNSSTKPHKVTGNERDGERSVVCRFNKVATAQENTNNSETFRNKLVSEPDAILPSTTDTATTTNTAGNNNITHCGVKDIYSRTFYNYRRHKDNNINNNTIFTNFYNNNCTKTRMSVCTCVTLTSIISLILVVLPSTSPFLFQNQTPGTGPLRVASFNIRHFGKSLVSHDDITSGLVKIFQRYDVVLVMEVRDSSHGALNTLKQRLNAVNSATDSWDYVSSEPLGRTVHYKEQYVFFYRPNVVKLSSSYQVTDKDDDVYEREPFAVEFEYTSVSHNNDKQRIVFMGIHTQPTSALEELNALPDDIRSVSRRFPNSLGVITMGDYNADCTYLSQAEQDHAEIFHSKDFTSRIPDDTDTTVSRNTDCAYDRVVVYGDTIDTRHGGVFNFEPLLHLTTYAEAFRISDHYPVEFLLY